jgi:predicted  nucleic acid-binding Zn-ribbon protein
VLLSTLAAVLCVGCSVRCATALQPQDQQLRELNQLNSQLHFKYEVAAQELTLQQQLSKDLAQQLEAAETQLQQAQQEQQGLLSELRAHQQQQLEEQLKQPAAKREHEQQVRSLQQQLAGVQGVVADKERSLQELTVKWNEAATQVEELQLQLQQESRNHQALLR